MKKYGTMGLQVHLQLDRQAAEKILASLDMIAVEKAQWEQHHAEISQRDERTEQEAAAIREKAREEVLRQYNITAAEVMDVTDLYYRHQALSREAESLRAQVNKLDTELQRMREHIEHEPQRIATAVEAAKVQIQNTIEQSGKR